MQLSNVQADLAEAEESLLKTKSDAAAQLYAKLDALSPLKVLSRGYAVVSDKEGHAVVSVRQVKREEALSVRVADGTIDCIVKGVSQ